MQHIKWSILLHEKNSFAIFLKSKIVCKQGHALCIYTQLKCITVPGAEVRVWQLCWLYMNQGKNKTPEQKGKKLMEKA